MYEATEIAWHNGKIVPRERAAPSIASHSLHLGIGVFDGMMAYRNGDDYYLHRASEHLARLRNGSTRMGLSYLWSDEELRRGIDELLDRIPPRTYYIRPIVYRPSPEINVMAPNLPVDVAIFGVTAPRDVERELRCEITSVERVSGRAIPVHWKICGTYVNSYLARREAQAAGFDDGIMLDQKGRITEASAANLFFVAGDRLVTPALTPEIFPGITRATLFDIAVQEGIEIIERDLYPKDIEAFDAAFLASTLMELKPLSQLGGKTYESMKNPVYTRVWQAFLETTHQ